MSTPKKSKKVNGLLIELQSKSRQYLIKNRHGHTVASTGSLDAAVDQASKDRRYIPYTGRYGGLTKG